MARKWLVPRKSQPKNPMGRLHFRLSSLVTGSTPAAELTVKERNLLSVAFKNLIGWLRVAWLIVSSIKQKDESQKNDDHVALGRDYKSKGTTPYRGNFIAESTFSPLYLPRITNPDGLR
ncbi:hypothetical protein RJ639_009903 [Escallonia herrerae]|uniref:14-3-3 domain-containing protein n=1 Tax=Escallonia herrerae TaxID=1293975 RepID=A0AA88VVI1_9ASTE|nr:hypothetical protein RJ639_009903 [Escallonia herrerae]